MTYIRAGLCVRPCSPMRIYVWAYATVRIGLCHRTCCECCKKTFVFLKKLVMFSKNFSTFLKKLGVFLM